MLKEVLRRKIISDGNRDRSKPEGVWGAQRKEQSILTLAGWDEIEV